MHATSLNVILFVVTALLLGAIIKILLRNARIPYTVVLLLTGMAAAAFCRSGWLGQGSFETIVHQVGNISPHLILYLFLPTLIFESAYGMEFHLFLRIAPQIILLAIGSLIISMGLTAIAVYQMLPWGLSFALLFGALISATDPVAVVALLKEKSSRKRLETLIEGESLLNDGTAIVFFSLFYAFAVGSSTEVHACAIVGEFLRIASGGILTGVAIGGMALWLIGRLINQALVEISLSIGAAYLTFIMAESFHVSGVVALVSLALLFSSIGRTRISPSVIHFLHQFWQMMAHIANTLIFLVVGIVIALHVRIDSPDLWQILIALYLILIPIRAISIFALLPLLKRIGPAITHGKALVLTWGGLRGAVALALALSLAQDSALPEAIREQILFLCAGIVVLTIVINGSTMEWLLHRLSLDCLPLAKKASVQKAQQVLEQQTETFLSQIKSNPFFNQLTDLPFSPEHQPAESHTQISVADLDIAFMRRLLEIERNSYWQQFEQGYIGHHAASILVHSAELALDNEPVIAPRTALNKVFRTCVPPIWLRRMPLIGTWVNNWLFSRLSLGYDVARGFVEAQQEIQGHLNELAPNQAISIQVEKMIERNQGQAFEFTRHLEKDHFDWVKQLQHSAAQRLLLNYRRAQIEKMKQEGMLEEAEARGLLDEIEQKMATTRAPRKNATA